MLQRIVAIIAAGVLAAACGGTTSDEPGTGDGQAAEKREETTKTKAPPTTAKAKATRGKDEPRGDREPPETTPEPTTPSVRYYPVTQVVDGDTVKVARQGETTIRIIGIDTPEIVDPNSPVECFGTEASVRAQRLLGGQDVRLVFDPSQGRKDTYDRTLAYVVTRGGADFGRTMVRGGFAVEYTYDTAYRRQGSYRAAEQNARAADRGLWTKCGGPHKALASPKPTSEPDSGDGGSGGGTRGCADGYKPCIPPFPPDVNCDAVDGPITVTGDDPHGLDADGDGVACES